MGNKDKRNKIRYSKKRRLFRGNQHKSSNVVAEENLSNLEELLFKCSSAKKMKILSSCCSSKSSVDIVNNDFVNKNNFSANDDQSNDCYMFTNTNVLEEIITAIGSCPKCSANVNLNHDAKLKKGLSHCIFISCASCQWEQNFYSSKTLSKPVKIMMIIL